MLLKTFPAILCCAFALLIAGCSSNTSLPQTQAGDPNQAPDFQLLTDIPIPSGATMDNDHSIILGERDRWIGRVRIKLWKSSAESAAFYQQQMPAFGWEPIMSATSGVSLMSFTRGDRAATIQIESTTFGSSVLIVVGQRPSGVGRSNGTSYSGSSSNSGSYGSAPSPAPAPERIRTESLPPPRR